MQQNSQRVKEAFARWSKGQGSILDLMDDDGTVIIPGVSAHCGTRTKREFVKNVATPFLSRFRTPPVPVPTLVMADGECVIVVAAAYGVTLDGEPYRNDYVFVLEFRAAKLVQATEFLDMVAFNVVWDSIAPRGHARVEMEQS